MNVASLELCKELYELSGWETDRVWSMYQMYITITGHARSHDEP